VIPGNEGRGYVLRRIIRRAIRHGYKLGQTKPFFHKLVGTWWRRWARPIRNCRKPPSASRGAEAGRRTLLRNLEHGMKILEAALAASSSKLDGETAFKLHDTYGFPLDLTADICRERNVDLDEAGFDAAMERQKSAARAAGKFKMAAASNTRRQDPLPRLRSPGAAAKVVALYKDGARSEAEAGQDGVVVLDTPRSTPNPAARWATRCAGAATACSPWPTRKDPGRRVRPPRRLVKGS
jgi:alanyl-tRNA synthetase